MADLSNIASDKTTAVAPAHKYDSIVPVYTQGITETAHVRP